MYYGASNDLVAQAYTPIILLPSSVTDTTLPTLSTISMTAVGESAPTWWGWKSLYERFCVCG